MEANVTYCFHTLLSYLFLAPSSAEHESEELEHTPSVGTSNSPINLLVEGRKSR